MNFLRIMGFSLALLVFYAIFANSLPQVEPDLSPPVEVSTDGLDMPGMIALGEKLFSGKGTCTLCHNNLGRAPDTLEMDLAATFSARLADARYEGVAAGKDGPEAVEDYIRESMREPSIFVVEGFGKKGTNDTESPMPVVDAAPIELNTVEMNAIIAFLQDRASIEPTVPLPSADEAPVAEEPISAEGMVEAPETDVAEALDRFGCSACHDLNGSGADIGPALGGIGTYQSKIEVMQAIIDPNAVIEDGYEADFMPSDFAEYMHLSELTLITDYLLALPVAVIEKSTDDEPTATNIFDALDKFGCAGCHDLDGSEADIGPDLIGLTAEELREGILDPNAVIADGYEADFMPDDFGEWMAESELSLIVEYLMTLPE